MTRSTGQATSEVATGPSGVTASREDTNSGKGRTRKVLRVLPPLVILVAIIIAWWVYTLVAGGLTPTPPDVVVGFWRVLTSGSAWAGLAESNLSLAIGFAVSVVVGVPLGVLSGRSRWAERLLGPFVDLGMIVPMVVVMPIILIAFGLSRQAQIAVIVVFAVPYIVVPIRAGIHAIPRELLELADSLCATERQKWTSILVPGALRSIVTGLRLGLAHALTGMILVELTLIALGVGRVVLFYESQFMIAELFGYVLLVIAEVFVLIGVLSMLERRIRA